MLAYLSLAISNGMNVFVAGESASGKTALLNPLHLHPAAVQDITIEDTPELQVRTQRIREVVFLQQSRRRRRVTMSTC